MGEIVSLHSQGAAGADAAWERYRLLITQALDNPSLYADRLHCEAMIRAWERFRRAFLASEHV